MGFGRRVRRLSWLQLEHPGRARARAERCRDLDLERRPDHDSAAGAHPGGRLADAEGHSPGNRMVAARIGELLAKTWGLQRKP